MGNPDNKIYDLVGMVKSWIPRRSEQSSVSRDFWMPDQSCRVCYECDSQFTVFNRRHHCRLCGRIFCGKCTANSIPAPSNEPRTNCEDWERLRVCKYCFKQWKQGITSINNGTNVASSGLSPSPSATSLVSTKSSNTCNSSNSTVGSSPYNTGPYQRVPYSSGLSPRQSSQMVGQDNATFGASTNPSAVAFCLSPNQYTYCMPSARNDEEDYDYGVYHSVPETSHFSQNDGYYGPVTIDEIDSIYGPHEVHHDGDHIDTKSISYSTLPENLDSLVADKSNIGREVDERNGDECEAPPYDIEDTNAEPVDFENNGLLWLPPEPEDEEDETEAVLFDDDEEEGGSGEWGYLRPSNSFGSGESRSRDKSSEENRQAMKNVVEGHFRALIAQFLQVENLSMGDEGDEESWLDIVTSLSWDAATLLKPDTSKSGGMDPGGYVKVKCIATGHRSESVVVKGVVCKKNVAHRRMMSKVVKPRFLILGGALEYQRVSNLLSSVDTLLQQEMDHLKMAVAKIAAHHPNVLLVEKSVSRYAQEYLLAKDISLVLNIKRPLLERIARCTGAQIVPSIDHLTSQKLGCCDVFHVEKFLEEHGSAGQGGKKLTKTLMFFEGCPKPLGCTILLKGANGDEMKKVKHVVQYGVFAAYHLALETSFLADEGASLPELPLKSPITVALPDKPSSIDRSISTIPGFTVPGKENPSRSLSVSHISGELYKTNEGIISHVESSTNFHPISKFEVATTGLSEGPSSQTLHAKLALSSVELTGSFTLSPSGQDISDPCHHNLSSNHVFGKGSKVDPTESFQDEKTNAKNAGFDHLFSASFHNSVQMEQGAGSGHADTNILAANDNATPELSPLLQDSNDHNKNIGSSKEEFAPSSSDHQSILVSLSTRCVWKETVCERAHLFRIKYYGSFDKPLGRFLRDHLLDQDYQCCSCEMPSEAHVYCYTHRQGSLTISVKKLPEFILPGEREGKIWMWHRCLRCPRSKGFPPATRRIVMSDAAWGLSFGKFLELSFSNHAAASRVASCGHSLHRDCLRFYGFGRMVACFRYASIDVHSVYLPPSKVEFNYDNQEWIQKEVTEVCHMAEVLFTEVRNALHRISEKLLSAGSQDCDMKAHESSRHCLAELEAILEKEKEEFEESLQKTIFREVKAGQNVIDILEVNKLRRQILFHSYVWDLRLISATSLSNTKKQEGQRSFIPKPKEKRDNSVENLAEMDMIPIPDKGFGIMSPKRDEGFGIMSPKPDKGFGVMSPELDKCIGVISSKPDKGFSSCESHLLETKPESNLNRGGNGHMNQAGVIHRGRDIVIDQNPSKEVDHYISSSEHINRKNDHLDESGKIFRRVHSDGEFTTMANLSDTLDTTWTGKTQLASLMPEENGRSLPDSTRVNRVASNSDLEIHTVGIEPVRSLGSEVTANGLHNAENSTSKVGIPFPNFYSAFSKSSLLNAQKLGISEYNPVYIPLFRELERQSGARLLLPVGVNGTIIPVYDDEPTSVIAYALISSDYHAQMSEHEKRKDSGDSAIPLPLFETVNLLSFNSFDESASDIYRSLGSLDEGILSLSQARGSQSVDYLSNPKYFHPRVSFTDDGPLGKVKYTVTCYFAKRFEALRKTCCPSELDFVRSISRCKKWGAQGGKSNVFFAKTLDDRFIIKQVTKTELESFIKFGPAYFKYLSETRSPTCLAKILGIYQVSSKHLKGGKESKMDVLVMENLLFRRNVVQLYDLKGSCRSRYNPDTSGSNKVLLDQNLIEAMPTCPIFVGNKAKRLLERAVWNDTAFLASIDVMDYSLLVGVDKERHELVLGIIDFMRQYTWDKHLETWVKTSGILGGSKNTTPTVISPQQYKKRFRKAMTAYFLMLPDSWSSSPMSAIMPSGSDPGEETLQSGTPID